MTAFFDTNVLLYTVTSDPRKIQAERLLRSGGIVSVQVLNEFANVARNKLRYDWSDIVLALDQFRLTFDAVLPLTLDTHDRALAFARDHGFSFYDALIIAAAIEGGCNTLYSEDMQHGRVISGLTIRNPFLENTQ